MSWERGFRVSGPSSHVIVRDRILIDELFHFVIFTIKAGFLV